MVVSDNYYEWWSWASGNQIAAFETLAATIRAIAKNIEHYGPSVVEGTVLFYIDADGKAEEIGVGDELVGFVRNFQGIAEELQRIAADREASQSKDPRV